MAKRKVLIPLDGSDFSRQILDVVRRFLSPEQYELSLLRVGETQPGHVGRPTHPASAEVPLPMYDSPTDLENTHHPIYASQEYDSAVAGLQGELDVERRQLEANGYTVNTEVRLGDPRHEIVNLVADGGFAMVAMTTHGRSGFSRMLSGSVAEHVMRHVSVPVMLLRPTEPAAGDGSSPSAAAPATP